MRVYWKRIDFWIHLFGFVVLSHVSELAAKSTLWMIILIVQFNFMGLIIEYEQKFQVGTDKLSWCEYFKKHSFSDLVGNLLGTMIGILI